MYKQKLKTTKLQICIEKERKGIRAIKIPRLASVKSIESVPRTN